MTSRPLALRSVAAANLQQNSVLQRWQRAGLDVRSSLPDPARSLLQISHLRADPAAPTEQGAAAGWHGLIDAEHWLAHTCAQLPVLLLPELHLEAAVSLFGALAQPLGKSLPTLPQQGLSVQPVPASAWPAMPCVSLPYGPLWLSSPPPAAPTTIPAWIHQIALPMRWLLGRCPLAPRDRLGWAVGDVLVLAQPANELWLGNRLLGCFSLTAEGLHMSTPTQDPTPALPSADLEALAVSLEFVLHRSNLSLARLAELQAGQVLALPADCHLQVQLEVDGQILGRGELVQLDGHLGVELQHVGGSLTDE